MLTSKDIPDLIGKTIHLADGYWIIKSVRVIRWAGLIATIEKDTVTIKVAVHNAIWDPQENVYRLPDRKAIP